MRRALIIGLVALSALAVGAGAGPASILAFTDLDDESTHGGSIEWASESGLLGGYSDGTFRPDEPVTRGQLSTILRRFEQQFGSEGEQGPAGPPGPRGPVGRDGTDAEEYPGYIPFFTNIFASVEVSLDFAAGETVTSDWLDVIQAYSFALPIRGSASGDFRLVGDLSADGFGSDPEFFFTGTEICIRLYNETIDEPVDGSQVCTTEGARTYVESSTFALPTSRDTYRVEVQGTGTPPQSGTSISFGSVHRALVYFEP